MRQSILIDRINGVWNLVFAFQVVIEEENGKFDRLPQFRFLERLHNRNEFYISSHHPLRETLINQTGKSTQNRINFLSANYTIASTGMLINSSWQPIFEYEAVF